VSAVASDRVAALERALRAGLAPEHLVVRDESHLHRGHAGAASGGGHFRVLVVSPRFAERSRLERHRMVYAALGDALRGDVHALALRALTPEEWRRDAAERLEP
jgi:BolA protein